MIYDLIDALPIFIALTLIGLSIYDWITKRGMKGKWWEKASWEE